MVDGCRAGDADTLVCFNAAARHLPYTTLGFLQYLAPTLVLLQAVLLFDEHLSSSTLVAFMFIWRVWRFTALMRG